MLLTRETRCYLQPARAHAPVLNAWAGWPAVDTVAAFVVIRTTVEGPVDPDTGYACDIGALDRLARERARAALLRHAHEGPDSAGAAGVMQRLFAAIAQGCPAPARLIRLELAISPYIRWSADAAELPMTRITQSFEFSAAHRLYCAHYSDEENRRVFGKCANPNGHGHNYVVEITLIGAVDPARGTIVEMERFQRTVRERVIERFDHKHLNLDCAEFADVNPSVENIARAIWDRLDGALDPAALDQVRVWETPKTSATYRGPRADRPPR